MRWPRILSFYLIREVLLYSLLGMVTVSVLFLGQSLLRYLGAFLMVGVAAGDVLTILRCICIIMLGSTLPIAFLFGVLVGIGRMASDVELTAMRACGIGLREITVPVFAVAVLVSCISWYVALEVEHRVKREMRDVLISMTATGNIIEPRKFTRVGDRVFYVENRDRENRLEGVFISDESDPEHPLVVFAERGEFAWNPETSEVRLRLKKGDLHFEDGKDDGSYLRMAFDTFEYVFAVDKILKLDFEHVRPKDMTMRELNDVIARARAGESLANMARKRVEYYEVQVHRRFALPVAPMVFALTAVPLALRRGRGARSWGALICAILVGVYYGILTFAQYMAVRGRIPAAAALWVPNALFALLGGVLLARARRFTG